MTISPEKTPDELRPAILDAVLAHVPFDGWSEVAIRRAAQDLGIERGIIDLAYPGGALDLIAAFSDRADAAITRNLAAHNLAALKVRERITLAVRTRIEANSQYRDAAQRAVTFLALPQNTSAAAKMVWRSADAIWRAVGDRSVDYNFYSKRAVLGAVFSATVFYWLNDESDGSADTWAFLDRRIEDVMSFEKAKAKTLKLGETAAGFVRSLGKLRYGI